MKLLFSINDIVRTYDHVFIIDEISQDGVRLFYEGRRLTKALRLRKLDETVRCYVDSPVGLVNICPSHIKNIQAINEHAGRRQLAIKDNKKAIVNSERLKERNRKEALRRSEIPARIDRYIDLLSRSDNVEMMSSKHCQMLRSIIKRVKQR